MRKRGKRRRENTGATGCSTDRQYEIFQRNGYRLVIHKLCPRSGSIDSFCIQHVEQQE